MNNVEELVTDYKKILEKIRAYNEAINVMFWDLRTGAPKKAVEGRSEVIGLLSTEVYELMTSKELERILRNLSSSECQCELDEPTKKSLEDMKKEFNRNKKIPAEMYREYVVLISKSEAIWQEAKEKSNFNILKPYLEQIVKYNKEFTELWGYKGNRYNALLDLYEPGMTVEQLDPLFSDLKEALIPLVKKVASSGSIYTKFLSKQYSIDKQKHFCELLLKRMGFDFNKGTLGLTAHPFQTTLNSCDIRIATKFDEADLATGIFSALHEGGHAQYEQNISPELEELLLYEGTSTAIHESQSRFWENIVGRSSEFWEFYYKELVNLFPEQLADIPVKDYFRAINEMKPSLIRIEADELTYNFHIMLRYEIEKQLINGNLKVSELPAYWNSKMEEYFGITPTNDTEGVLQDVHWAEGMFGYFPTYTLGNIYAAQIYNKLKQDLPEFNDMLRLGNLIPIKAWLNKNIHQHGKLVSPNELIEKVTGEPLNAKYLIDYLTEKVDNIYKMQDQ